MGLQEVNAVHITALDITKFRTQKIQKEMKLSPKTFNYRLPTFH